MLSSMAWKAEAVQKPSKLEIVRGDGLVDLLGLEKSLVSKRAYAIYEAHGSKHGGDKGDWLQAESDVLHSVPIGFETFDDHLVVFITVLGGDADEISVGIEPRRVIVLERRKHLPMHTSVLAEPTDLLRVLDLAFDIDPWRLTARLTGPELELLLPKTGVAKARVAVSA